MKKLLICLFLLVSSAMAQRVDLVGTLGGYSGYKFPYAEGKIEANQHWTKLHFGLLGEVSGASARKADVGNGWHVGAKAGGFLTTPSGDYGSMDFGGGIAYAKQWTDQYSKPASHPFAYAAWNGVDNLQDWKVEFYWLFKGTDTRNGDHGAEIRYTVPIKGRWSLRLEAEILRGYETDQPKRPVNLGGASIGVVFNLTKPRQVNP